MKTLKVNELSKIHGGGRGRTCMIYGGLFTAAFRPVSFTGGAGFLTGRLTAVANGNECFN